MGRSHALSFHANSVAKFIQSHIFKSYVLGNLVQECLKMCVFLNYVGFIVSSNPALKHETLLTDVSTFSTTPSQTPPGRRESQIHKLVARTHIARSLITFIARVFTCCACLARPENSNRPWSRPCRQSVV